MSAPILYLVIPCYNEEAVLPLTAPVFEAKIAALVARGAIDSASRVLFVDDGSRDRTWEIIARLAAESDRIEGIALSRNRGHQNALLAGLMEVKDRCDITVSLDCDGQDDPAAIDAMVAAYAEGCEVVYGVRSDRKSDSVFKRTTAQAYYRLLNRMGAQVVYNHADYRLLSARVLRELAGFKEVNLFLRGMIPLVGFKSTSVYYERHERQAGKTHYPLAKMLALAFDGITSLSVKPIRLITGLGAVIAAASFVGIVWSVVTRLVGHAVDGWASMVCMVCLLGGVQLVSLGVIGEYVGKIYLESKARPRYIIRERTAETEAKMDE